MSFALSSTNTCDNALSDLANVLKASGDSLRMGILQVLGGDAYSVQELCTLFDIKQSAMSHHLKVLASAELLRSRREGNTIFYRRALPKQHPVVNALFSEIDSIPLSSAWATGVAELNAIRAKQSQQFFADNATQFERQKELISHLEHYQDAVCEVIQRCCRRFSQAIELGPGDGGFLPVLSAQFEQVIALDNAATMLSLCQQHCSSKTLDNVHLVLGDSSVGLKQQLKADCIIANMVLHHNANPQAVIADCTNMLATDGVLVITELCAHEQDWVRDAAGDVWLGFTAKQLERWAKQSALHCTASTFLALRNGFRLQVHAFSHTHSSD